MYICSLFQVWSTSGLVHLCQCTETGREAKHGKFDYCNLDRYRFFICLIFAAVLYTTQPTRWFCIPFLELSLPFLSVCIEKLNAWDRQTIAHWQPKLGLFLYHPAGSSKRSASASSHGARSTMARSAWISKLEIQMSALFKLSTNHKYHPDIQKHFVLQMQ